MRRKFYLHICIGILSLFLISFSAGAIVGTRSDDVFKVAVAANEIKVMSYNVQNLFDAEHDEGFDDWAFLPIRFPGKMQGCQKMSSEAYIEECEHIDWTERKLQAKLHQLRKVVEAQGALPDLFAAIEIENDNVTEKLAQALGYEYYLVTHSETGRGGDVALLFNTDKLNFLGSEEVLIKNEKGRELNLRPLLRVEFEFKTKSNPARLFIFVNHWAAMSAPTEMRMLTAGTLKKEIDRGFKKYGDRFYAVAIGDFNVGAKDSPHAFDDFLYSPKWKNSLIDGQKLAEKSPNPSLPFPPGTYHSLGMKKWQLFDRAALTRNMEPTKGLVRFVPESFRLVLPNFMATEVKGATGKELVPTPFNFLASPKQELGYSDHLPVVFKLMFEN